MLISFARTPEKVQAAAQAIGQDARAGTPRRPAEFGDLLADKIIWDTTNPFASTMDELLIGTTTSAGEEVAKAAPRATVIKAIPPFAQALDDDITNAPEGPKPSVFVCGDDEAARTTMPRLVADLEADAVDTGPLKLARFSQPAGMLVTNLAYVKNLGSGIALSLLRNGFPA